MRVATAGVVGRRGIERRGSALNRLWHRIDAFPLWGSQSLSAAVPFPRRQAFPTCADFLHRPFNAATDQLMPASRSSPGWNVDCLTVARQTKGCVPSVCIFVADSAVDVRLRLRRINAPTRLATEPFIHSDDCIARAQRCLNHLPFSFSSLSLLLASAASVLHHV